MVNPFALRACGHPRRAYSARTHLLGNDLAAAKLKINTGKPTKHSNVLTLPIYCWWLVITGIIIVVIVVIVVVFSQTIVPVELKPSCSQDIFLQFHH